MNIIISFIRLMSLVANGLLAILSAIVIIRAKDDNLRNFYVSLSFALLNIFTIMAVSSSSYLP